MSWKEKVVFKIIRWWDEKDVESKEVFVLGTIGTIWIILFFFFTGIARIEFKPRWLIYIFAVISLTIPYIFLHPIRVIYNVKQSNDPIDKKAFISFEYFFGGIFKFILFSVFSFFIFSIVFFFVIGIPLWIVFLIIDLVGKLL